MNYLYCLIPIAEITQAMLNRSTSNRITEIPILTIAEAQYYIIKFKENQSTSVFDNYVWHTHCEIHKIIKENT